MASYEQKTMIKKETVTRKTEQPVVFAPPTLSPVIEPIACHPANECTPAACTTEKHHEEKGIFGKIKEVFTGHDNPVKKAEKYAKKAGKEVVREHELAEEAEYYAAKAAHKAHKYTEKAEKKLEQKDEACERALEYAEKAQAEAARIAECDYVDLSGPGGEWYQFGTEVTDTHGRLTVNLEKRLPIGIHKIKMIVAGDHSFLDMFIAIVPIETSCVVFSIDGSLTGSVSVTGRDPRVRPGAVDVVRYWQQQGYLILYVTARPDMQQRVVGAWLAQHNFPHGLLFFTPSLSTDPLRQKTQYLKHLVDLGIRFHAAYGSNKDVHVYTGAGIDRERIFSVAGGKRRGCVSLEDGYSQHLHDLHAGRLQVAQPVVHSQLVIDNSYFTTLNQPHSRNFVQRTHSFTPRSGKYHEPVHKKCSQLSICAK